MFYPHVKMTHARLIEIYNLYISLIFCAHHHSINIGRSKNTQYINHRSLADSLVTMTLTQLFHIRYDQRIFKRYVPDLISTSILFLTIRKTPSPLTFFIVLDTIHKLKIVNIDFIKKNAFCFTNIYHKAKTAIPCHLKTSIKGD